MTRLLPASIWPANFLVALIACAPDSTSGMTPDVEPDQIGAQDTHATDAPDSAQVDTDSTDSTCGPREALGSRSGPILGGTTTWNPEVLPLDDARALAVGGLFTSYDGSTELSCTATLVAPRVVLTAAHCLVVSPQRTLRADQVEFAVGADLATPRFVFEASAVHVHPSYSYWSDVADNDVAIIILAEDATVALGAEIAPVPINCGALVRDGFVNQRIQVVGYGATDRFGRVFGTKQLWAVETIVALSSTAITVDGGGSQGVCYGDSGGPAMFLRDGVIRVVGVLSLGDPICGNRDDFVRTDTECSFLSQHIPACGGVTERGSCSGPIAEYCEDGALIKDDCGARGATCTTDADGRARCDAAPDPCNGESFAGRCAGDTVIWCEANAVQTRDCAACSSTCATHGTTGLSDCQ